MPGSLLAFLVFFGVCIILIIFGFRRFKRATGTLHRDSTNRTALLMQELAEIAEASQKDKERTANAVFPPADADEEAAQEADGRIFTEKPVAVPASSPANLEKKPKSEPVAGFVQEPETAPETATEATGTSTAPETEDAETVTLTASEYADIMAALSKNQQIIDRFTKNNPPA